MDEWELKTFTSQSKLNKKKLVAATNVYFCQNYNVGLSSLYCVCNMSPNFEASIIDPSSFKLN